MTKPTNLLYHKLNFIAYYKLILKSEVIITKDVHFWT